MSKTDLNTDDNKSLLLTASDWGDVGDEMIIYIEQWVGSKLLA